MTRQPKFKRQEAILAELRASPAIRISQLALAYDLSTETIRRDLDELSERGLLSRTYGGAAGAPMLSEPPLDDRYRQNVDQRTTIARAVGLLVQPGETLMIDAGATTIYVARRLAAELRDLTVVTTSFGVASSLALNASIAIRVAPGEYDAWDGGVTGPDAHAYLKRFNVSKAIIGASRLDAEGPSDSNSASVWIKRVMIECAQQVILALDYEKLEQVAFERVAPLSDIDHLVTDKRPSPALLRALDKARVEVHVAETAGPSTR